MDYALTTWMGGHFAHIYAREEHMRLRRLTAQAVRAIKRHGRNTACD